MGFTSARPAWAMRKPCTFSRAPGRHAAHPVPCYSLLVLLINSSSSRAGRFLWTSRLLPMLARTCGPAKPVRRAPGAAGATDNNLAHGPRRADNCHFVPKLSPGLSTSEPFRVEKAPAAAGKTQKSPGPEGHRAGLITLPARELRCGCGRAAYLEAGAPPSAAPPWRWWWWRCSPPLPWWPSAPPRFQPRCWRWDWASKVFCCSGVSAA